MDDWQRMFGEDERGLGGEGLCQRRRHQETTWHGCCWDGVSGAKVRLDRKERVYYKERVVAKKEAGPLRRCM